MSKQRCEISGEYFTVSPFERKLREQFGFSDLPTVDVPYRFRELGAFWPHWTLHRRECDKTGKSIISIFRPDCVFPVWDRKRWIAEADPPTATFNAEEDFFSQAFRLFQRCPIPHTFQSHNENCEFTDDFYHSRNCYLCHSSNNMEDGRYCYYCSDIKDSQFCVYSLDCELCCDATSSHNCYRATHVAYCRQVSDSAFLYDCRNCSYCMFCCNLRNKQYCFNNQQLTKEEYLAAQAEWNLTSRAVYDQAREHFQQMLQTQAWHRTQHNDMCEDSTGNYLSNCKNCEDCFIAPNHEDCVHDAISGPNARTTLDSMGTIGSELAFNTVMCVYCYQVRFSFELNECRFCDYCMYCFNCKNCFGCCGLYGKEYCIFNKQYSASEYAEVRDSIIAHMQTTGEWGRFFPGHFAPNPYEESCSGFFFPISTEEQQRLGFRTADPIYRETGEAKSFKDVPDSVSELCSPGSQDLDSSMVDKLIGTVFWDAQANRPFNITNEDIQNSLRQQVPLPNCYYVSRIQELFRLIPFSGTLRETTCAKSGAVILTSWPAAFDGRILSEEAYLDTVV
ncbi:hypothetical protein OAO01_03755 [Oligoflexia bacterium]|nr:hypothetical protein [Oligoflexia bacterium]